MCCSRTYNAIYDQPSAALEALNGIGCKPAKNSSTITSGRTFSLSSWRWRAATQGPPEPKRSTGHCPACPGSVTAPAGVETSRLKKQKTRADSITPAIRTVLGSPLTLRSDTGESPAPTADFSSSETLAVLEVVETLATPLTVVPYRAMSNRGPRPYRSTVSIASPRLTKSQHYITERAATGRATARIDDNTYRRLADGK